MSFNVLKFLNDQHLDHITDGPRHRPGWVQTHCPFCSGSSRGYDLGYNLTGGYFSCWQCRGKSVLSVVKKLMGCGWDEAGRIVRQYEGGVARIQPVIQHAGRNSVSLPPGTGPMTQRHKDYLVKRNFDPDLLEKTYDLQGTGHLGLYAFRIVAPIYLNSKLVSFQCRDYTGKVPSALKYLACEKRLEVVHHKHILYGMDLFDGDTCVIDEGVADSWRLGPGAIATFGTGFTTEQVALIAKLYKRAFIVFDPEPTAQLVAEELAWVLESRGVEAPIVQLDGSDPGDMKQDDANALMRQLNLRGWKR